MSDLTTPEEKLKLAIMSIMLRKEFSLFKCILYHYDLKLLEGENCPVPTAGICYNRSIRKFQVLFNADFVDKLSLAELRFVILHEVLHALHKHIGRTKAGGRFTDENGGIWNLAGDHVINTALKQDADDDILPIKIPKEICIIPELTAKGKVTVEEAYEFLLEKHKENTITITISADGKSATVTDGKGNCKSYDLDIQKSTEGDGDGEGKDGDEEQNGKGLALNEEAGKLVERALNEIKTIHQIDQERGRGCGGGSVMGMLEELIKVEIPNAQLLARAVARKLTPSMENRSWRSLNRIYQGIGMTISGHGDEENIDTAIYVIDSSGSINDEELKMGGGAVVETKDLFARMIVMKHDWVLLDEKEYEGDLVESDLLQFKGRGGTSHKEPFERIEELYQAGDQGIGLVILYTDYESDVEELVSSKRFGWVEEIPIQVMIPEGRYMVGKIPKHIDKEPIVVKKAK